MRLKALDTLRGIALLSMILFHAAYDINYIFGYRWDWFRSFPGLLWQTSIGWTFIIIAGMSFNLSRNNLRRSLQLGLVSLAITVVTYFARIDTPIWFGVIHCLALCTLLCCAVSPLLRRISNPMLSFAALLLLAVALSPVKDGYIGLFGIHAVIPAGFYEHPLLIPFGFPTQGFSSGDYYPLLPYLFVYLAGHELFRGISSSEKTMNALKPAYCNALSIMGRHSLVIYLTHQAVVLGILYLAFSLI